MRKAIVMMGLLTLGACLPETRVYDNSELVMYANHAAKEMCSCVFVTELTDAECEALTRQGGNITTVTVDHDTKVVRARAALGWTARAHFRNERSGCVLDD